MKFPRVKTLSKHFPEETARKIRQVWDKHPDKNAQGIVLDVLAAADLLLNGFGVERIPRGHNQRSPEIYYVNMGDTYRTTLMYVCKGGGYFEVGNWGSIVERGNYD